MKRQRTHNILYISIIALLLCNNSVLQGQEANRDFEEIKKIFLQQEQDWNKGDIDAFMEAYWKDEALQFGGAGGITRGWRQTLERYKKGYPDKETMGQLTFQIKDMTQHSDNVISLTGSWVLERKEDRPGGHFLLIWRKIDGEWKIVVDHTSQRPGTAE